MLQGETTCGCSRNTSSVENITSFKLKPDNQTSQLTTSNGTVVTASSYFENSLFFKYSCNAASVFGTNNCFNSTYTYFDPRYLAVTVSPSANIMSYLMSLNNTNLASISSNCGGSIKANTYLLYEGLGGK